MDRKELSKSPVPHQIIMQDRKRLDITGVTDVDRFDDTTVVVFTSMGSLSVKGDNLQIRRLDLEGGNLSLEGEVDSLIYSDSHRSGGVFGWLVR